MMRHIEVLGTNGKSERFPVGSRFMAAIYYTITVWVWWWHGVGFDLTILIGEEDEQ